MGLDFTNSFSLSLWSTTTRSPARPTHADPVKAEIRFGAVHEIPAQHLSAEKARMLLAWKPTRTVDEALAETVAWYRDELAGSPG